MLHSMQRKTVNFIGSTSADVAPFFNPTTVARRALQDLVEDELTSDSDVIRALVSVGIRSVVERQLEIGYSTWANSEDDEDRAWSQASTTSLSDRISRDDG